MQRKPIFCGANSGAKTGFVLPDDSTMAARFKIHENLTPALRAALSGQDIDTVRDGDLLGEIDPFLWRECSIDRRVPITAKCTDFLALAATARGHPGLLLARVDGRPTRQT